MPRSKRDNLKRSIAQSTNHIAGAIVDVYTVRLTFGEHHPELTQVLEMVEQALEANRVMLVAFAQVAWEVNEDALMSYL